MLANFYYQDLNDCLNDTKRREQVLVAQINLMVFHMDRLLSQTQWLAASCCCSALNLFRNMDASEGDRLGKLSYIKCHFESCLDSLHSDLVRAEFHRLLSSLPASNQCEFLKEFYEIYNSAGLRHGSLRHVLDKVVSFLRGYLASYQPFSPYGGHPSCGVPPVVGPLFIDFGASASVGMLPGISR